MRRPPRAPRPTIAPLGIAAIALLAAMALPVASAVAETPPAQTTAAPTPTTTVASPPAEAPPAEAPPTSGAPAAEAQAAPPAVQSQHSQRTSGARRAHGRGAGAAKGKAGEGATTEAGASVRGGHRAVKPSALTPALPLSLQFSLGGVPAFFIESFQVPPFLLPIFQAAGTAYGIPWQVLAAINEVETDYGRDLSVSSAGAEGWMQFLPSEWAQYGVDANGDGFRDPYNPADAIFAAARYLHAAGGETNIRAAVLSYNHSQAYVESVMLRAHLLGSTPPELLGAITGLTEARFPVHAAAHFSDGFPSAEADGSPAAGTLVGSTIYSQEGAPVIAVADGKVVQIGESPHLGHFVVLRDAYGNTYTYGRLGDVASVYPVLEPRLHSSAGRRITARAPAREAPPSGPATAGAQPRSPLSEGDVISGFALGAAAGLEGPPPASSPKPASTETQHPAPATAPPKAFSAGANEVYLHSLVPGVEVIAGTVLGHVGGAVTGSPGDSDPQIVFEIRPAGVGAPLIDPKPILDGWVALEDSSIFHAKGENPFLATSPTVGQTLLESKEQLQPEVLRDRGIRLGRCGRQDVQEGRVDKRVLAVLEYLSVSGLGPTVAGLPCPPSAPAAQAANTPASATSATVRITAINGIPVAGHQGPGSLADNVVRKMLMLQGASRPTRIVSALAYPGVAAVQTSPSAADAIEVSFGAGAEGHAAGVFDSTLTPAEWTDLVARLGEIPDPTVPSGPTSAAIPDGAGGPEGEGAVGGND